MVIRYSMIQSYLECPKAFYDRYVLNKIETEKSSALEFGQALHLGIRTILNGEDGVESFLMYWNTLKDVHMKYYGQGWIELKDLACDSFLPNFKARHAKKFTKFEQEVQMEMRLPVEPFGNHTLRGTADLAGYYEGRLSIVDWKTSSKAYRKNKIEINPQLYIYSRLYEYNTGILPEQIVYKVFNKKNGSINTVEKDLTIAHITAIFTGVENAARQMIQTIQSKELYHGAECFCEYP